ncbi:MAG TPA: class I SAM-dependent methyltransferase [Bacteroidota bacterium]|nr:class I SAM-dependent methyltransferase [Bacteroidota bacterium]
MADTFSNVYDDKKRAESYDRLEYPGTYYLAFRDIPAILQKHIRGTTAVDFGCGTGRSTRFLRTLGFEVVGVDISTHMLSLARKHDPSGSYHLIRDGDFTALEPGSFDLVFSAFTFDNIPTREKKVELFKSLKKLLRRDGKIVSIVSTPEIYVNEWASFSTRDYPQNRLAQTGNKVRIVMLDVEDRRPVEDIVWMEEDYLKTYESARLKVVDIVKPLGKSGEPFEWKSETRIAPWAIYVLGNA